MKVQFFSDDNYQTMYIDGQQVLSGHELYPEDVVAKILGAENVHSISLEDIDEDELEDIDGDTVWNGVVLWKNGVGHPEEYPFDYDED